MNACPPAPAASPALGIDPTAADVRWARGVGDAVARVYRLWSTDRADVRAFAVLVLFTKARAFDWSRVPEGGDARGLFRGWVHPTLRSECRRECARLRNGGTYRTRRDDGTAPPPVECFSALDPYGDDPVNVYARPGVTPPDPPLVLPGTVTRSTAGGWSPCCTCVGDRCNCDPESDDE